MKKMVAILFLLFLMSMVWADNPHPVLIEVIDSGGNPPLRNNLSFAATVLDGPGGNPVGNTLTKNSYDCGYPSTEYPGLIEINLGQFGSWSAGDYMRVTVSVTTEEPDQSAEFLLTDDNYQLFYDTDRIQLGIIEEDSQSPDLNGDITFLFDYGNNTRADDIQVNVNSEDINEEHEMTITQYERASYTIPNFAQTIDIGFDLDDTEIISESISVEIRWNSPDPSSLTTPTLVYKDLDISADYWQFVVPDDDDTGTYTDGWDLNVDGTEPDEYNFGVKFSLSASTIGSATNTKWAIGKNTILDLQPTESISISSSITGTEASTTSLNLSWDEVIGADTYDILVADSYNGTYSVETSGLSAESGTVSLSNTTSNTIKYYKIQGKNDSATDYDDLAVSTDVMLGVSYGISTTLITNNALIAFPVDGYSSYTNASDLIGFIDECDCISQWDADSQSWNSMGRIFGEFAGWDTDLDFVLEANTPVVFNVMSGIDNLVLAGEMKTSVQFTLKARAEDTVTYNYIYLPLDSSISTGLALAGDITNCSYVGKFDYDSQNWDEITTDDTADSVIPGDLLRVGITGSTPVTWPSGR
ncbi:MAG: hypothetical protein P9X26_02800 [Candidatus Stygibacter frigidus]|nr:hypothetical protein [Candidatus Stygibacter frigidus]